MNETADLKKKSWKRSKNKKVFLNPNLTNKNNQSQLQFYFLNADSTGIGIFSLKQA